MVLTFQIISDIHLEINQKESANNIPVTAEYLALLGDIGRPHKQNYTEFLQVMSTRYKKVFVIAGNHEYYNEKKNPYHIQFKRTMNDQRKCIKKVCQRIPNVIFLDNSRYDLEDYRILGTTLWTYIPERYQNRISMLINDYEHIYIDQEEKRRLTPADVNNMHTYAKNWLQQEIKTAKEDNKKVIIFTHHSPLRPDPNRTEYLTCDPKYINDQTNYAYCADLSSLFDPVIKLWGFGHTHYPCDFIYGQTRVLSNPRGYYNQVKTYNPGYVYIID